MGCFIISVCVGMEWCLQLYAFEEQNASPLRRLCANMRFGLILLCSRWRKYSFLYYSRKGASLIRAYRHRRILSVFSSWWHPTVNSLTLEDGTSMFPRHRLTMIRKYPTLSLGWLSDGNTEDSALISIPLFIFATTIYRALQELQWDVEASLTLPCGMAPSIFLFSFSTFILSSGFLV